jgi:hypothetical protein
MGFVIRSLFVIGVLYLLSPMRAALPEWLAHPTAGRSGQAIAPALASLATKRGVPVGVSVETLGKAAIAACKGHEKACLDAASTTIKGGSAGDAIEALLKQSDGLLPATDKVKPVAMLDTASDPMAIPLPPRREPGITLQKKI